MSTIEREERMKKCIGLLEEYPGSMVGSADKYGRVMANVHGELVATSSVLIALVQNFCEEYGIPFEEFCGLYRHMNETEGVIINLDTKE